jgi:hypothetical protein
MTKKYCMVFDLDETLGHFGGIFQFWNLTKQYLKTNKLNTKYFFNLLDLYPEILRPNIFNLLNNIKKKKINKQCDYVLIYTNNNGPKYWTELLISYFHHKLKYNLFDKIIKAFTINGKIIEICRTSSDKSYTDFIACTKFPENTKVFFLDDQYHKEMQHKNVYYFNVKPYFYNLKYRTMAKKFSKVNKELFTNDRNSYIKFIVNNYVIYDKNKKNINEITPITEIIKNVDDFFPQHKNKKTIKKQKINQKNKSMKK